MERRWELAGLAACGALFFLLRFPLYVQPGIVLGWNSDAALLGLMARAIVDGDYPIIFWASDYLAPLTSVFAAAVGVSIGEIGPLALRIGVAIEVFAAILFCHAALRRIAGPGAALLATLWLTAGPAFLFRLTYAPLSAEQYFFVGSIAFWYVTRAPFVRLHQWLVLGLLAGLGWWIHRGVTFVVVPALLVIFWFDRQLVRRRDLLAGAAVFSAAAILGYTPAIIGRLLVDQRLYAPIKPEWNAAHVMRRAVESVQYDLWTFLGADDSMLLGVILVAVLLLAVRHFRVTRESVLAAAVAVVCAGFWLLTLDSYRGALRYVMIALPIAYAFAAAQMLRLPRWLGLALIVVVTAALFVPRHRDVGEIVAARREQFELFPGGFDPRPALQIIDARRYPVCYANVWIAHKLEWLSASDVRFIPYRSVNRRVVESLRLGALPGPKCFVSLDGKVRTLTPAEEAQLRVETLWHGRGWTRKFPPLD